MYEEEEGITFLLIVIVYIEEEYRGRKLCNELGVKKLVHVSALGVKEDHPSRYMQSKLQGENNIQNIFSPLLHFFVKKFLLFATSSCISKVSFL